MWSQKAAPVELGLPDTQKYLTMTKEYLKSYKGTSKATAAASRVCQPKGYSVKVEKYFKLASNNCYKSL